MATSTSTTEQNQHIEHEEQHEEPTFEETVSSVVSQMVQNDKGVWEIPKEIADTLDEPTKYAVKAEKRHRDTQSEYTKARKQVKELETVNDKLTNHLIDNATMHITEKQREELDELKLRDPDAWREKLNEYETESRDALQKALEGYRKEGKEMSELEVRQAKMEAFVETTGIELNDEIVENQLPAKLSKDLEAGRIDFDQFLEKAHEFLTSDRVIKDAGKEPEDEQANKMNKLRGSGTPSERAQVGDIIQSYKDEIY